jgi:hypothetical protein
MAFEQRIRGDLGPHLVCDPCRASAHLEAVPRADCAIDARGPRRGGDDSLALRAIPATRLRRWPALNRPSLRSVRPPKGSQCGRSGHPEPRVRPEKTEEYPLTLYHGCTHARLGNDARRSQPSRCLSAGLIRWPGWAAMLLSSTLREVMEGPVKRYWFFGILFLVVSAVLFFAAGSMLWPGFFARVFNDYRFDLGENGRVTVSVSTLFGKTPGILFTLRDRTGTVHGPCDCGAAPHGHFGVRFEAIRLRHDSFVAVYESSEPHHLIILYDADSNEYWPFNDGKGGFPEHRAAIVGKRLLHTLRELTGDNEYHFGYCGEVPIE